MFTLDVTHMIKCTELSPSLVGRAWKCFLYSLNSKLNVEHQYGFAYLKFLKEGRWKIPDSLKMGSLIPAEVCLQPGNAISLIMLTHIVAGPMLVYVHLIVTLSHFSDPQGLTSWLRQLH